MNRNFALSVLLLVFSGCAPSLSNKLEISPIPTPQVRTHIRQVLRPVRVESFDDMRTEKWIARIKDGRTVEASEPVGSVVQDAVVRGLAAAGFKVDDNAEYGVVGDVKSWNVKVEVNFPSSKAVAESMLDIYVIDSRSRIVFSSSYGGSASAERPMLEDEIPELLKESMQLAVGEALNDEKLLRALKTY